VPANLKALIVVLAISAVMFSVAKPLALRFGSESDFTRRRNVWLVLTIIGFLSPNFWLFALVAIPVLAWGSRKDSNPVAFYLIMLHVIPVVEIPIPVVWMQSLFSLEIYRLLALCVLVPAIWRLRQSTDRARPRGLAMMDVLLLAYGFLEIVLNIPSDSFTGSLRRAFLFYIDAYVVYFAVSRLCTKRASIVEALGAFCLSCALMAAMGVFETARHWLLYADFSTRWGVDDFLAGFYLFRGNSLRAVASSTNTLALGYLLAIAFGFWLYLMSYIPSARSRIGVIILYWMGLLATYSRGPWMGAVAIYFCFSALGPRARSRFFKATFVAAVVVAVIGLSPLGTRIAKVLPFMGGSVDSGSIDYRHQLAARAWDLFLENPLFGDKLVLLKMEDLRQGVGLIDLVNTYAEVALFDGLVGLTLFVGFILIALLKIYRLAKKAYQSDPDLSLLGASLASCIVGTLMMIATCSFIFGYEKLFYVLAGLATAYSQLAIGSNVPPGIRESVKASNNRSAHTTIAMKQRGQMRFVNSPSATAMPDPAKNLTS
jgi:hypothetical protein